MTPLALKQLRSQKKTPVLIDVRTPSEFEDFNLGGIHLPMDELLLRIQTIEHLKNTPVVLVCGTGIQSSIAVRVLQKKGFLQAENLEGGIEAWLAL